MIENEPPELFWGPYLAYKCLKSLKNQPWPPQGLPRDAKGRPEASREPLWGLLGCIFDPQRPHFGAMLPSFLSFLPLVLSSPSFLASFHFFLPPSFVPLLPSSPSFPARKQRHQETKNASNQETKQPRNQLILGRRVPALALTIRRFCEELKDYLRN